MVNRTHKATDKIDSPTIRARRQEQGLSNRSTEATPAESFQRYSNIAASHRDILALQQTVGNQAVRRMLKKGSPAKPQLQPPPGIVQLEGDESESVRPTIAAPRNIITSSARLVSRSQENILLQRQCGCEASSTAEDECKGCGQESKAINLQRAAVNNVPYKSKTRAPIETPAFVRSGLDYDFSAVRVHEDTRAVEPEQGRRLLGQGFRYVVQRTLTEPELHRSGKVIQREPTYDECTPAQEKLVKKTHDHAQAMVIRAIAKLYSYDGTNPKDVKKALKRRFDTTSKWFAFWAAGRFLQILIQTGSPQYECEEETEGRGWAVWCLPGSDIELRKDWFADSSIKERAKTMIHEWFHRYGCHLDLGYHSEKAGAGHGTARSIANADSWARFATDVN